MKKVWTAVLALMLMLFAAGCTAAGQTAEGQTGDYPAALMVEGKVYYLKQAMPAEIDPSAIQWYTESYTDTFPQQDNQTNFDRELGLPIAKVEGGVAVLYQNEWYFCQPEDEEGSGASQGGPATIPEDESDDVVLLEPPELTILYGEEVEQGWKGTYTWYYENEDGSITGLAADSVHPLQAKDLISVVRLMPTDYSHIDPLQAGLRFEVAPDKVTARCWSEAAWGHAGEESEKVEVAAADGQEGEDAPQFTLELKDGAYIYEITAQWTEPRKYSGTATYSFSTTGFGKFMEPIEE